MYKLARKLLEISSSLCLVQPPSFKAVFEPQKILSEYFIGFRPWLSTVMYFSLQLK